MLSDYKKPKILAIIVTFNRPEKLRVAIEAAFAQEECCDVLVVDNASSEETRLLLDNFEIAHENRFSTLRLRSNAGGAGGFFFGIKEGYKRGYEAFWLMDDDCIALPSTLRILANTYRQVSSISGAAPGFVCSNVRWIDGDYARMNSPAPVVDWLATAYDGCCAVSVRSCSFVSVLLPRAMVLKIGLPLREYFIWFDDTEYTSRITKIARGILCLDSIVVHDMEKNEGADASITEKNLWKFKYRFRNEGSYYWHVYGKRRYFRYFRRAVPKILKAEVGSSEKLSLFCSLLQGPKFDPRPEAV